MKISVKASGSLREGREGGQLVEGATGSSAAWVRGSSVFPRSGSGVGAFGWSTHSASMKAQCVHVKPARKAF